jgi:hypothetical protein
LPNWSSGKKRGTGQCEIPSKKQAKPLNLSQKAVSVVMLELVKGGIFNGRILSVEGPFSKEN